MKFLPGFCALLFSIILIGSCGRNSDRDDGDWFSVQFISLCEDHPGVTDFDKLEKYGTRHPYDTTRVIKGDSLIISFDFMDDCCLTFSGQAQKKQDTLVLKYGWDKWYTESCGCICEYRLIYRIYRNDKIWRITKILHDEKNIFKAWNKKVKQSPKN